MLLLSGTIQQHISLLELSDKLEKNPTKGVSAAMASTRSEDVTEYAREALITYLNRHTVILHISGILLTSYSWLERYFDATSYESIMAAVAELHSNDEIDNVILRVSSGGGYAEGCGPASDMLKDLALKKNVVTYAINNMASAAYWLGCRSSLIVASPYADIGSIGGIAKYMTQSRSLTEAGVDIYVSRTGPKKQVLTGIEPISQAVKTSLDAIVLRHTTPFFEAVKSERGAQLGKGWDSGDSFASNSAVQAGLVDRIAAEPQFLRSVLDSLT